MTIDRRTLLKRVAAGGAAAALAGCVEVQNQTTTTTSGEGSDTGSDNTTTKVEPGKVTAWVARSPAELKSLKEVTKQWDSNSPHSIEVSDIADLKKKTTSAIPAGQGPTTFEFAHDWVGQYYQAGFISDQSQELDVDLSQFTGTAQDAVQFDGATVGLPTGAETVGMVYNKDLVDEPPKTISELKTIMEEHHDPDNGKYGLAYPLNPYFCTAWARAWGGYYFDHNKDPQLGLTKSETVKGFKFILDTFLPYMANDTTYGPQASIFAQGNAPIAFNGPWYLSTLDEKGINYGTAELPKPEGGSPSPHTGVNMWYFSKKMNEGGPNAAATRAFTTWYATNKDLLLKLAKDTGNIPVLKELAGSEKLPEHVRGYSNAVKQGVPMPSHPKMQEVWDPVGNAISSFVNGDAKVESALQQAEEQIRKNWQNK